MALTSGTRLGTYEIVAAIGSGGMGEVYRAHDTNLKRDVAIKVLPEAVAADPERLARFQREAELLASLNHPNIAQIYGLEQVNGTTALVMELVEGVTLAELVAGGHPEAASVSERRRDSDSAAERRGWGPAASQARGHDRTPGNRRERPRGLAIPDSLAIARQIADALEAAHEQGIIHRDLKPANVKVRDDGTVKVLDFGLAKALGSEGTSATAGDLTQSPTITTPAMTQMGMILGTAAYMSPEQAKGRPADKRSDIWAFGCVLYEMLTGRRAFAGDDVSDTMASVLKADVDWGAFPAAVPATVVTVIRRCLQRDPAQRARDIGDVRLALEGAFETPAKAEVAIRPAWRQPLPVAAGAAVVTLMISALAAWTLWPTAEPAEPARFLHELPDEQVFRRNGRPVMALSRDGRSFVYNTSEGLYVRTMDAEDARLIPGTEGDLSNPFFSPGGESVGYYDFATGALKRIRIEGGTSLVIGPASHPWGVSWETDDMILLGQPDGIYRVSASGGTPQLAIAARDGERVFGPQLLPDGDSVLFSGTTTGSWDEAQLVVGSLSTGERTVLPVVGSDARYVATGHLLYALEDTLFAQAFDPNARTVSGRAEALQQGLMRTTGSTGAANYAISEDGTLVYVSGESGARALVWIDQDGNEEPIPVEPGNYNHFRLSHDRTRVALNNRGDVFVGDLAGGGLVNVTASESQEAQALWTPSGDLVFASNRAGPRRLYSLAADGTGTPEPLTEGSDTGRYSPESVSPDGTWLVYRSSVGMRILSLTGDQATDDLLIAGSSPLNAEVSPNGRWIAYESSSSGQARVYVSPFPDAAARQWTISPAGGTKPAWGPDGRELFYIDPTGQLMSVEVDLERDAFVHQPAEELLDVSGYFLAGPTSNRVYAVDDGRFLFLKPASSQRRQIHIVLDWTEELKQRVPVD